MFERLPRSVSDICDDADVHAQQLWSYRVAGLFAGISCDSTRTSSWPFLRAGGSAKASALATVQRLTWCLRSMTRPDMPLLASARIARYFAFLAAWLRGCAGCLAV